MRKLLSFNNKLITLPKSMLAYPTNPIILDLKSSILYNSPVEQTTEFFKTKSLSFITSLEASYSDLPMLDNNLVNSFKSLLFDDLRNSETSLLKRSQYKHMRKSIANMVRIQADKAVAMPIDTRIQLLTVSKDIIHSWAIPSAGIKIDCIPGYSSHKVTIFLLSGVYWGQCMEICGRFHH